ncbi:MAG: Holliday junction branch migration protein RuvA [Deltaproteobacteria bacterium]|nr:Holliday junction branch migration protein RuvA [Deltaproteobacteria bacterium]
MIAYLNGKILSLENDSLVLLTESGVGYQVFIPQTSLQSLNKEQNLSLHIQTIVREDAFLLFGFENLNEKTLFNRLLQVNSVGPKLALAILSSLSVGDFQNAILGQDLIKLKSISGVGKKTAERILLDLKDKVLDLGESSSQMKKVKSLSPQFEEALSALINLGMRPQEAERALNSIPKSDTLSLEDLVREGLKALS